MKSPENMQKWGFPDGRDRSSYPDNEDSWSDDRWRWEFTRRRPDYCEDFVRAAAETVERNTAMMASAPEDEKKLYASDDFDPENPDFMTTVDHERFSRKYGIGLLVHPKYDFETFPFCFRDSPAPAGLWIGFGKGFAPLKADIMLPPIIETVPLPEGFAAAVVDLSKKLEPQIKEMTALLLAVQKQKFGSISGRRKHRGTWIRYLRVIDARAAGATLKDLADIASSGEGENNTEQNALQVWEAARHLMFNWPT
jgi:hypothetical protein